jgi:hypothetical protein
MKKDSIFGQRIIMPKGRVNYPQLFTPGEKYNTGKYSCSVTFDKNEVEALNGLKLLKAECLKVAQEAHGKTDVTLPFKTDEDGMIKITAKSSHKPDVVGPDPKVKLEPSDMYGGCYVRVSVTPFSYHFADKIGVGLILGNVQKVADGERFGKGGVSAANEFDVVAYESESGESFDDDSIPF